MSIEKRPGETDREHYYRLLEMSVELARALEAAKELAGVPDYLSADAFPGLD